MSEMNGRGGVGTLTRPAAAPPQPAVRQPPGAPRHDPAPPQALPAGVPGAASGTQPRVARRTAPGATRRMPFFVMLCGLLGGALISALVISTTLAEGSFQITKLQQSDSALARQRQQLQAEVAAAQSAQVIEQRAYQLGMRPVGELRFLNLKTGKIETDAGSGAEAAISVPGYTP